MVRWKKNEHLYHNLAQLFGAAGNIVNNKRGALLPENVGK